MNFNIMKNLFVYIFTVSVCKICTLQSEKKKQKKDPTSYILTLHYPLRPLYAPVRFWTDTPIPYLRTCFIDGPLSQ